MSLIIKVDKGFYFYFSYSSVLTTDYFPQNKMTSKLTRELSKSESDLSNTKTIAHVSL